MGSLLPDQRSNPHPLHWKVDSQPLDHQGNHQCRLIFKKLQNITIVNQPHSSEVKVSACNVGDLGLIPGSGRSPGEGNGNLLQYSCLENPMDWGAWWAQVHRVAKSRTWLSDFTHSHVNKIFFFLKERYYYSWQVNNLGVAAGNWSLWAVENLHITYGQPFISVIPLYPWIQPTADLFTVGKKSRYK